MRTMKHTSSFAFYLWQSKVFIIVSLKFGGKRDPDRILKNKSGYMEHVSYPLLIPSYEQHSIPSFKYYCFILENTKDLLGL